MSDSIAPVTSSPRSAVRRPTFHLGVAAPALLWLLTLGLAITAAGDSVLPRDAAVARWVQRADGSLADAVAAFGNSIGAYWTGAAITAVLSPLLVWRRQYREVALLVAILGVRALNNTVKGWIDSPRPTPDLVRVSEHADGLGFPSGHAMGATLLFGALVLIALRTTENPRARLAIVCAGVLALATTAFGRVHTGAHWPSDVLGGILLGAALLHLLATALRLSPHPVQLFQHAPMSQPTNA